MGKKIKNILKSRFFITIFDKKVDEILADISVVEIIV